MANTAGFNHNCRLLNQEATVSWELNEGPQTVGLQAFSGLPADAALGRTVTKYRRKPGIQSTKFRNNPHETS